MLNWLLKVFSSQLANPDSKIQWRVRNTSEPLSRFADKLVFRVVESNWPIPIWEEIAKQEPEKNKNEFWTGMGGAWVDFVAQYLGPDYRAYESDRFLLISSQAESRSASILQWLEKTHSRISQFLGPLREKELIGKCIVIAFADEPSYYEYISHYYEDGEHGGSGGIFINEGYGHFAFPFLYYQGAESVMAHELSHSLVSSHGMPIWLNEGIAQLCEEAITGYLNLDYDEIKKRIDRYWNSETIQEFWTGKSFSSPDEGQVLSYHLAQGLTYRIMGDRDQFNDFALEASADDAGESALQARYSMSLNDLVSSFLGEGNWRYQKA